MRHHLRIFFSGGSNAPVAVTCAALSLNLRAADWWYVAAGLLLYFIVEYWLHRLVLHPSPACVQTIMKLSNHAHHHAAPREVMFVLPIGVLVVALPFVGLYRALGLPISPLLLGNLVGFLYYEWVHYVAHTDILPRTRWGRWVKRCHMLHHFRDEHYWYGVSLPLLDLVFGTAAPHL